MLFSPLTTMMDFFLESYIPRSSGWKCIRCVSYLGNWRVEEGRALERFPFLFFLIHSPLFPYDFHLISSTRIQDVARITTTIKR